MEPAGEETWPPVSDSNSAGELASPTSRVVEEDYDEEDVDGLTAGQEDGEPEIDTSTFEEVRLSTLEIENIQSSWEQFMATSGSKEAAGEAIYTALFEGAPTLQVFFTTPRAVQAIKFMTGLASFVSSLDDLPRLKVLVETLAFGHLHLDVTLPRVSMFRDAILDLFLMELGDKYTTVCLTGWKKLLNYVGGAIIFVKAHYAERITTLLSSWQIVNSKANAEQRFSTQPDAVAGNGNNDAGSEGSQKNALSSGMNQVPTTYDEMFRFNATVMGFGNNPWLQEVLACFDNIVTNVSNSVRLQEECDVLVLRIARVCKAGVGSINFNDYKSCMLASLRSLLPKEWSTSHEVAWSWLWENVERTLQKNLANPTKWEAALSRLLGSFDENTRFDLRKSIYAKFFVTTPAGQDYFKQSNTYLHLIAENILRMSEEIYRDPIKMVDDISALGLRHVGYGIPIELFSPFVSVCVECLQTMSEDANAINGFSWSLALISKILTRTISEGSTIVMKAINVNSAKQLQKALACAPRGQRAGWMLTVQVGTQSISPLAWAIESGSFEAAEAIIRDLLTFRADRDKYYYGADALFDRHPDIVKRLCEFAPGILHQLLDGLIWRARVTEAGMRRVNYYMKHLLVDKEWKFSQTLHWIASSQDAKIVCHPVMVLLSDLVWSRLALRYFLLRKLGFFATLLVFLFSQALLDSSREFHDRDSAIADRYRYAILGCRVIIYLFSLLQLLVSHARKLFNDIRRKNMVWFFGMFPVPKYLAGSWQETAGLGLAACLLACLTLEPLLWCLNSGSGRFAEVDCDKAHSFDLEYRLMSMFAMLLYYALLIDLTVVSTKVSAYVLVCIRMMSELALFLFALVGMMLAWSSALSALDHDVEEFDGMHKGMLTNFELITGVKRGETFDKFDEDWALLLGIFAFLLGASILLLNMLIAQLTCAYEAIYEDMLGFARLERVEVIVATMPSVSESRWQQFLKHLGLDKPLEFNRGDVGVAGGVQILEPASANPTVADRITRFGGSTSPDMQWPEEVAIAEDEDERFTQLEKQIQKAMKRMSKKTKKRGGIGTSILSSSGFGSSTHRKSDRSSSEGSVESD